MSPSKVNLKDPMIAAILAFLLPGLGHFYQRRIFKGVLYAVCILGTFFTGLRIGHGQVVYFHWKQPENRTYAYLCQFWAGLPALPALAQVRRAREVFEPNYVPDLFTARLEGSLSDFGGGKEIGKVTGKLELRPEKPGDTRYWIGKLKGTVVTAEGSKTIEGEIQQPGGWLEPQVAPSPERGIRGQLTATLGEQKEQTYKLDGFIPRTLWDSYEAPLQDMKFDEQKPTDLDRAHKDLGGRFELGVVYTMIAGLLNILAMYDAGMGPAYGDEEEDTKADKPPPDPSP
jgi:TM2 domain-containing membrane protein YozV